MVAGNLLNGVNLDVHAVASLLDELRKLPVRIERPQTFMEIGGYPHYENVCSNFLAFFFDPERPHGLGSLFLDALMTLVGVQDREESFRGSVSVDREVVTKRGNRIDILIKSDSRAVLIENKIYAAANNPFDDYSEYLGSLKNPNGDAYEKNKILLTLYLSSEGKEYGFINRTHADFVGAVRSGLGDHISEAEPRYLPLMLDFLNTLEHLREGTRMNQEFVKLLGERKGEVEQFLDGIQEIKNELKEKVRQLGTFVQVEWAPFNWPPTRLNHALLHRIYTDEKSFIGIQAVISPVGWEIQVWSNGKGAPKRPELEGLLRELDIPVGDSWPLPYSTRFSYDKDLSLIASDFEDIVDKIGRSVRSER